MRLVRITALASVWLTLLVLVSLGIVHPGTIRAQPSPSDLSPRVDSDQDRIVDALEADFARARPQDALPVIVVLRDRLDSGTLDHLRQRVGDFPVPFQYPGASAFAARLTRGQARALADSGLVAHIEPDSPVTASIDSAIYWSGVQQGRQDFGLSGSGVNIAIIDSGINPNHPDLSGKIVKWTDVITGSTIPHDGCAIRHGTMVASVAAGTGAASQGRYAGIAPGAGLVVVKALNDVTVNGQPFCTTSVSIVNAAIQWVIDNRAAYNIRVLNLSVGTLDSCNADNNQSTVRLVNQATSLGIVPVIAAGNSGPGPCTISVPGIAAQAITVGAMADPGNTVASETPCGPLPAGGFYLACFSSRGPTLDGLMKPDVTAPGVHLMAAYGGFDDPSAPNYPDRYVMVSGTSVAAPFVAGVVALMLQASPSLTPAQVKAAIMDTAVDWGPPGRDNEYGAGILRAYEAIKAVRGGGNAGPLLPNHIMLQGALPAGSSGADCLRTPSAIDYNIYIVDPTVSIAATIVITNWNINGTVDIDACLFDRSGNLVASSDSPYRQETVGVWSAPSGPYRLRLFTYSGSAPATYTLDISVGGTTVAPGLYMAVDTPPWGQTVKEPFAVAGWALDSRSGAGPGVEYVHVWAYPAQADGVVTGPPRFLGAATLGGSRPDVGNVYGRQYDTSGFNLNATGLPGGYWRLIVYAKSAISGQVIEQHRLVYVPPMAMNVDVPTWGSRVNRSLSVAGWALDQASCCNAGIEYVHVWAYPALADGRVTGEPPIFLGAGQLALSRPDVAAVYGAQYRSAGFTLSATLPRAGYWRLIVYAKSSISGQVIEQHRLVQAS